MASDSSICPEVDSASKNEYQGNLGGKGGRCVRLTTNHFHVPLSRNLGALTSWNPCGPVQACNRTALALPTRRQIHVFDPISRSVLPRRRNVSVQIRTENQNTYFVFNNIFPKIVPFYEIMWGPPTYYSIIRLFLYKFRLQTHTKKM
jgi:hypothetical protein